MFFNVLFGGIDRVQLLRTAGHAARFDRHRLGVFRHALPAGLVLRFRHCLLRMTTETIAPAQVRFPMPVYHLGRLVFGLGGAVVTMSIIILAFHAAPVHKKIFDVVDYQSKPPFGLGLDHQFLGFFQHETGAVFARYGVGQRDPFQRIRQRAWRRAVPGAVSSIPRRSG